MKRSAVLIDRSLATFLKEKAKHSYSAKTFFLGMNDNGVVVAAVPLKKDGGCGTMPRTEPANVAKATIELWNRGLVPCGIARVRNDTDSSYTYGALDSDYRGVTFVVVVTKKGIINVGWVTPGGDTDRGLTKKNWSIIRYKKGGEKKNGKNHQRQDRRVSITPKG